MITGPQIQQEIAAGNNPAVLGAGRIAELQAGLREAKVRRIGRERRRGEGEEEGEGGEREREMKREKRDRVREIKLRPLTLYL